MKLPSSLLSTLRGPALAATLVGCGGAADPPALAPEPIASAVPDEVPRPPPTPVEAVAYDARLEAQRLDASEAAQGEEATRRDRRLAAAAARTAPRRVVRPPRDWMIRCGRG